MEDGRTLTHQCVGGDCYCDWRLNIYDCVDSNGLRIIYMAMIIFSAVVSVCSFAIFLHRLIFKGHRLFDFNSSSILKPKPIDCLMFFLTVFNLLRMLTGIILVTNVSQTNILARTFMFEFPWQWGYGACALYLLGIAQTLADSHKSTARLWLPSAKVVDRIGLTFLFAPFIVNNVCSIASGILASGSPPSPELLYRAEIFTRLLYVFWFIHCGSLACAVLYAGARLLTLLTAHLRKFKSSTTSSEQQRKVQAGMLKIRLLVAVIFIALAGFAVFLLIYGCLRDIIIQSVPGSYALCVIWNFLGPVASFLACIAVVLNPRIDEKPTIGLPNSSGGGGTTLSNQVTGNMFTTSVSQQESCDMQGTLSANAFDTLQKIKDNMVVAGTDYPYASFDYQREFENDHYNHYQQKNHNHHKQHSDGDDYMDDYDEGNRHQATGIPLRSSQSNLIPSP
ncbi:hypothetical protein BCR42DRAFT_491167 [Absidia repens]|uniref:G-protein coupled receptors family 1 profile domain-containing protein n=1 Tax=Absidia repens TaxID=90262 RepID=A0A1X2IIX5_9FUNG|nr:hypothetical protein BCR42DRAFT_491167 [Absidia repens]